MNENHTVEHLMKKADVRSYDCYQCGKCSGGCPMLEGMDYGPRGIMRCAQAGALDSILHSSTIWLCSGCYACVDRCPHDVNVPAFIEEARYEAARRGIVRRDSEVLNRTFLANIKAFGRSHEMLLAAFYNVFALKPTQDLASLPHMISKKLIPVVPDPIRGVRDVDAILERAERLDKVVEEVHH
jgi:heterodisulfide reductase subunit C